MDAVARNQLIEAHYGFAIACASRFIARLPHDSGADTDAVRGAALEALVRCADRWDPGRGTFMTFAWPRMWGEMRDELRKADPASRQVRERSREMTAAGRLLLQRLGRQPTDEEIAAELGWDTAAVVEVRQRVHAAYAVSLDGLIPLTSRSRHDVVEAAGDHAAQLENESLVATLIMRLPERERLVVTLYYFEQLKQREIAKVLEVSEARISQLLKRALQRMRAAAQVAA